MKHKVERHNSYPLWIPTNCSKDCKGGVITVIGIKGNVFYELYLIKWKQ